MSASSRLNALILLSILFIFTISTLAAIPNQQHNQQYDDPISPVVSSLLDVSDDSMSMDELLVHALNRLRSGENVMAPSLPFKEDWRTKNRSLGMCSMYGVCDPSVTARMINCPNNVPAVMVRGEISTAMEPTFNTSICPRFMGGPVCCDEAQYNRLTQSSGDPQAILSRCPACYASFLEVFCELTCSPNQASFFPVEDVLVLNQTLAPNGTIISQQVVVNHTSYYMSADYAEKFYNSCRDVKEASTGTSVMQFPFGDSTNYEEFLAYLGQIGTTTDKSPMQIDFIYTSSTDNQSMTLTQYLKNCNDSDSTYTCSCGDCRWCDGPQCVPHTPQPESQLIFAGSYLDPLNFGLLLCALTYLAVLMAIWAIRASKRRLPSSLLHVSRNVIQSIRCGHQFSTPFLVLSVIVVSLFLVGLPWVLFWGKTTIPDADQQSGTVHFLDSYWQPWLLGLMAGLLSIVLITLLVASCFTSGLGSFKWTQAGSDLGAEEEAGGGGIGDQSFNPVSSSAARSGDEHVGGGIDDDAAPEADDGTDDFEEDDEASIAGVLVPRRKKFSISDRMFTSLAGFIANHPWKVILLAVLATGGCAVGIINIELETDPIKLWVPPDSEVFQDKQRFDSTFGAFYRTEQVIFLIDNSNPEVLAAWNLARNVPLDTPVTLFDPEILRIIYDTEITLQNHTTAAYNGVNVTWDELCNRPTSQGCVRMSITGYFDQAPTALSFLNTSASPADVKQWAALCSQEPAFSECRSDIGVPMFPKVIFGGFNFDNQDFMNATALITTYLLNNEPEDQDPAEAWEKVWLDNVQVIRQSFVDLGVPLVIHFSAERSVQDELSRSSSGDIPTISISYGVMFVYISLALGRLYPFDRFFLVRTKCMLGFSAILLVLFSLAIAVGLVCSMGVKMTPIISEVIPFLVLAIGIDNVFILLNTFERQDRKKYPSIEVRLKRTMREVGTSITLASFSEAVAFILGGQTKMPAVRAFAFYSCAAILADYLLQITAFAAIIVLDARRTETGRMDCCPCVKLRDEDENGVTNNYAESLLHEKSAPPQDNYAYLPSPDNSMGPPRISDNSHSPASFDRERGSFLQVFMHDYYAPFLLHRFTKMVVLIVFVLACIFLVGYGVHNEQLGLDHKYVVPSDSYLQDYFEDLEKVFAVGPPVYFVIPPSNLTDYQYPEAQNRICSQSGCSPTSVISLIFNQVCDPTAYIAQGPSSWIDDYITWLKVPSPCCRITKPFHKNPGGKWCPVDNYHPDIICPHCVTPDEFITYRNATRPPPDKFTKFLPMFLYVSQCSVQCGSCGWGHNADVIWDSTTNKTGATRYMAYHAPLRSEQDFINALKSGRRINQQIQDAQGFTDAYVYSVVYPYFEQYLYIVDVCILNTGLGIAGIFVLSMALIRNLWASLQIVVTICMILGDLLGVMALWNITLNALSVLNFVMAIGISVEFCIHLTVAFMHTSGPRDYRVGKALVTVGSSIISGITLTKFSGVVVLAAAASEVFRIYYFRMYLAIVVLGCLHGLMFLPVLLSLVGPPALHKRKGWVSFFSAVDDRGVDNDAWAVSSDANGKPRPSAEPAKKATMMPSSSFNRAEFQPYSPYGN